VPWLSRVCALVLIIVSSSRGRGMAIGAARANKKTIADGAMVTRCHPYSPTV